MRDPKRIAPILESLCRIWEANPDLRLAQIISNACRGNPAWPDVFSVEDATLMRELEVMAPKSKPLGQMVGEEVERREVIRQLRRVISENTGSSDIPAWAAPYFRIPTSKQQDGWSLRAHGGSYVTLFHGICISFSIQPNDASNCIDAAELLANGAP